MIAALPTGGIRPGVRSSSGCGINIRAFGNGRGAGRWCRRVTPEGTPVRITPEAEAFAYVIQDRTDQAAADRRGGARAV